MTLYDATVAALAFWGALVFALGIGDRLRWVIERLRRLD